MKEFTILPAIDIKEGKCVRLRQGKAEAQTIYSTDPVAMALDWQKQGAKFLHVVDLDGAFQGHPVNAELIAKIAAQLTIPIEVGGGIRSDEHIRRYIEIGVRRVILGTRAVADIDSLKKLVAEFGPALAVGIDARAGKIQIQGWTETVAMEALELAKKIDQLGVQTIIYTDTARDGMMAGTNVDAIAQLAAAVKCSVIASGGITTAEDVRALRAVGRDNIVGAIVGKALYEGSVTLRELQGI